MVKIKNFVENQVLEVDTLEAGECYPATVNLHQSAGSTRFAFAMLPAQAREMAVALEDCARELEDNVENAALKAAGKCDSA